ncbi:MAG: hypothetical protein KDN22_20235 [Verrucomicrobiae bacterium]|nr:hypothetical protein [Verrucomicrobiae bacterium]
MNLSSRSNKKVRIALAVIAGISVPAVLFAAYSTNQLTGTQWVQAGSANTFSASRNFAVGYGNWVGSYDCGAIGYYLSSSTQGGLVVGKYNKNVSGAYFVVGNGTSSSTSGRKNALEVYSDGRVVIPVPLGDIPTYTGQ